MTEATRPQASRTCTVPSVQGRSLAEASTALFQADLQPRVASARFPAERLSEGVGGTFPPEGTLVDPGQPVELLPPDSALLANAFDFDHSMPNVTGEQLEAGVAHLSFLGFTWIDTAPDYTATVSVNVISGSSPAPYGWIADFTSPISVYYSATAPGETVTEPPVTEPPGGGHTGDGPPHSSDLQTKSA